MVQIGGKQNRKGKKQKKVVEYEEVFQLDLVIIKKFALLNIVAPENNDDLEDRLAKIAERKEWFEQNGVAKL